MHSRLLIRLIAVLIIGLFSVPAFAQYTKDRAAKKKIDEAINQHYLVMDMDKAESILRGTIKACGNQCSPKILAEAWMYIGIVRGSGHNDQEGAAKAFSEARVNDANVHLDEALATPETQATFTQSGGGIAISSPSARAPQTPVAKDDPADSAIPGDMLCTPDVRQVQTRRPIPVSCETQEQGKRAELKFKTQGGDWKKIAMKKQGSSWQAEIPCSETNNSGPLEWYVQLVDTIDEVVDSFGSRKQPSQLRVVDNTDEPPPAFPGRAAPARCPDASDCPPDFPGCGGGAQSCDFDDDCTSGSCIDGTCASGDEPSEKKESKHWIGLHAGIDMLLMGTFQNACVESVQDEFNLHCYAAGDTYPYHADEAPTVQPGTQGGFAPAQVRLMLSYEYTFHPKMSAGLRAGYAVTGPPASFIPINVEARFSYYFLGNDAPGFRPYAHAGAGYADVQGLVVRPDVQSCRANGQCETLDISVYQRTGPFFVTAGAGFVYTFGRIGVQANLNAMLMQPWLGTVLQPTLGVVYGL